MHFTIKFIYNTNEKFTKLSKWISISYLNELNSNYTYKIFKIPINDISSTWKINSSIIIFDNILANECVHNFVKKIRFISPLVNFIFLTKKITVEEKVYLYNMGIDYFVCDDIYAQNFLLPIIKNIIDKTFYIDLSNSPFFHIDNYCLDLLNKRIWKEENLVETTKREFDLFKYFIFNRNKVLSNDDILQNIWGYVGVLDTTNLVSQHVFRIRKKLELSNLANISKEGYIYLSCDG